MKFLNKILRRKEEKGVAGSEQEKTETRPEKPAGPNGPRSDKISGKIVTGVIRAPRMTEKTAAMADRSKFVFTVVPGMNKVLIRQAVEGRYGVKVKAVRTAKTSGKERKRGRQVGWKPGIKKAIVTLEKGQIIEFT